jgi:hypothetical protein
MITPTNKHDNCQVEIRYEYNSRHFARLHCVDCNKYIQWLSKQDVSAIEKILHKPYKRTRLIKPEELGI